jgi:two-component system NtrC family sensor kinase
MNPPGQSKSDSTDRRTAAAATENIAQLEAKVETYKKTLTEIYELYDKKIEELSLIRRIGDSVRTPLDLETLCREIVDAVAHEITMDRLALLLVDQGRHKMWVRASYDAATDEVLYHPEAQSLGLELDQGWAGQAAASGQPVLLPAVDRDQLPFWQGDGPQLSVLFLPLVARDKTVGLFALGRGTGHPLGEDEVRILTIISDQAATALANVQLFNELAAANIGLQESERQARQTSLYLENLLEAANDVIFTLDADGYITYVNRKVLEWGYDKDELLGRSLNDLTDSSATGHNLIESLTPDQRQILEAGFKTAGGERREVLLSTSHIAPQTGRNPTWLVLARDITERKQLERQLFHSEKLASIGILAAGVAHEIGNPLSAISGYTQILQSSGLTQDEISEYLAAIAGQTNRIQRIIEDLLNYSRPSTGHRSEIDLAMAIPAVMSMLTAQKVFKNVAIVYELDPGLPLVNMDRDHLAQIIINIALNAAQAMDGRGSLTITGRSLNDEVLIGITDTGPGLAPELLDRVFDPFFTTKPVGQGTGLGLAICHRIVESYNGSIDLESGPGRGTTFTLRLPAQARENN